MVRQKTHERKVLRLRQLRRARELTQEQLADLLHVTPATISGIEKGRRKPSFDLSIAIAALLGEPVEQVFSWVVVKADSAAQEAVS